MTAANQAGVVRTGESRLSTGRRAAPIIVLLLLAPVVVDVLFGAIQITTLVALVPTIPTYGCAALLIRGVVRTRRNRWPVIVLLGVAYAIAEECLIVQTSLAPLPGAHADYGRAAGVNWPYLIWALGYESVWSILLPIQLTELIFPRRRRDPWLGSRGLAIVGGVLVLGAVVAWHTWTRVVRPTLHEPSYAPPVTTLAIALGVVAVLVCASLWLPYGRLRADARDPTAPAPWLVGVLGLALGVPWFLLTVTLPALGAWALRLPAVIPIVAALVVAGIAALATAHWTASAGWTDSHRLALITGALVASMGIGFIENDIVGPMNLIGKIVLDLAALALLAVLSLRQRK